MKHFAYMVRCYDGTLYSGYTIDLEKRLKAHNSGKGAKYTKTRLPVFLVYYEVFETKSEAMKREVALKKLTKIKKEQLVNGFTKNLPDAYL